MRREYRGRTGVAGLALGTVVRVDRPGAGSGDATISVDEAFARVSADLVDLAATLRAGGQREAADIAVATLLIAEDPDLRSTVDAAVASGASPGAAVEEATERYASLLAGLPDPTLAGRAVDVRAVGRRLLAALTGSPSPSLDALGSPSLGSGAPGSGAPGSGAPGSGAPGSGVPTPGVPGSGAPGVSAPSPAAGGPEAGGAVLVGREVAADDLLTRAGRVGAVVSVVGGAGAHTAIVARAMGVPAVFGVDAAVLEVPDGASLLVDGAAGTVVVDPDDSERTVATARVRAAAARREQLAGQRDLPTGTRDGYPIAVYANVAGAADNAAARERVAAGIGLVRTEMPFLAATHWPDYGEHMATLVPLLDGFDGRPVTVRTLDFADDKLPPFLRPAAERAGSGRLGRGLPLLLAQPEAFAAQFRAIVDAGADTRLRIMIPMVASVDELLRCGRLLDGVLDGRARPGLGAMIELPEAVADADTLAGTADFFSIGSNDLTAALLGLTRRDPALTPLRAAEPVVLQAIARTADAARRAGIPVSVCGDAAAEPVLIPLLVGLGCDTLSVAPAALDETRALVRELDHATCVAVAYQALAAGSLAEATALGAACLP